MWFMWRGVDSRAMGVWVSELPPPTRAAERVQEISIPGRAGSLTLKEGENVHEAYQKDCRITVPYTADFPALLDWLTGEGEVIFANEPDRVYTAHIAAQVQFTRISNSLKQATIPFFCQPHKGQYPPETDITLNASGSLYNPGTVAAEPIVTLTLTQAATARFGAYTMRFEHTGAEEETITVDCGAELVTQNGEIWEGNVYGDFWRIEPGAVEAELTDCTMVIKPRWRWY